ncbi:hypothetical protein COL516b_001252 [Colletotrichum fioriniae]|nr:uncharacterized protein COL516b_001252 [Colletotrichum fioriniae]KAJ0312180.1 hypothetical protein COL516b_001252 [Colletotrichum fioriniae]
MDTERGTYPERQVVPGQDGHDTDHSSDDHAADSTPIIGEKIYDDRKAWITVAASSLTMFVYLGVIYSWGIMQVKLVETTGSSLTTLTFVGSMATSFMICFSIVSDKIISRIGYRLAALTGGFFMGLGEVLASFTTNHVVALFFLHGLVFGLGGGLCIFSVSTAPMGLFKNHKALAMGFVFGGGSLGSAIMSVVANYLVKDLGVSWTFRILGFILWGVSIPASYFLPRRMTSGKQASRQLQWYRFKEPRFLLLVGGTILSCFPLFIPPYFIPIFSRSMGYTKEIGIVILACWNLASTLGRVIAGWVADTLLGPVESLAICMLFMALSSLIVWPLSSSIGIFSVYLIFNGIGCVVLIQGIVAARGAVTERQSSGCLVAATGFASLNGGTTGGAGGTEVTVTTQADLEKYASASGKYVIKISGRITISPLGKEIKIASDKTVIGLGTSGELYQGGLGLNGARNIIIRNLKIGHTNLNDGVENDRDGVQADTVSNIWIDHCLFEDGGDGLVDLRKDTTYFTVSNNIFRNHDKTFGIGWTENVTARGTINHNWFDNTNQRNPSADNLAQAHLYNNYLYGVTSYGHYARGSTNARVENVFFEKTKNPLTKDSGAVLNASGNTYKSCTGTTAANSGTSFDPKSLYSYTLTATADVPAYVKANAGPRASVCS